MIVKFRKSFFTDLESVQRLEMVENIEFLADFAKKCATPEEIPGFKRLRQYPGKARIEAAPFRVGVEVSGNTIIFCRIIHRSVFYNQFP